MHIFVLIVLIVTYCLLLCSNYDDEINKHLQQQQLVYGHLIQNNLGELVLSQRRDLLEQPLL